MSNLTNNTENLNKLLDTATDIGVQIEKQEKLINQITETLYTKMGGINTSDATATAEDIAIGKTAYVNGEKITGTSEGRTSAELEAEIVIQEGIIAELQEEINSKMGGVNTSDANASANDILAGKTAYVNGEKITGTFKAEIIDKILYIGG